MRPCTLWRSSAVLFGLSASFSTVLAGCFGSAGDEGRVDVYPVSGKVTMNGAPVPEATVTFSPKGEQPVAFAMTNAKGEYSLTTYESGDGAAEGEYAVLVTKSVSAADTGPTGHDVYAAGGPAASHGRGATAQSGSALPKKYGMADQTPLNETVKTDGENVFDLALSP